MSKILPGEIMENRRNKKSTRNKSPRCDSQKF